MKGYIYKCECLINNKIYVGQTYQNYKYRWHKHEYNAFWKESPLYECKFYRAIRKHGLDNFKWEIIETINQNSIEELIDTLNVKEIYYINEYDSFKNGYNSTLGGDNSFKSPKSVVSFNDKGAKLKSFKSASDAANFYNINTNVIWSICGRFSYYTVINNNRIIFRWDTDTMTKEDVLFLQKCHYDFPVDMYNLQGELLESFPNVTSAAKRFNLKNERITATCRGRTSFVQINGARYIFKYCGDAIDYSVLNKANSIKSDPKMSVIAIDSVTKEIIGTYPTQSEGAKAIGTVGHNISEVISGKRKSAGKYNGHPVEWIKK